MSATATTPFRATGSAFSATRYVSVPSPCPLAAEVITIHDACDVAFHAHSRATPIAMVPTPPAGVKDDVEEVAFTWQRVVVVGLAGLVTLVDVELPHATTHRSCDTTTAIRPHL